MSSLTPLRSSHWTGPASLLILALTLLGCDSGGSDGLGDLAVRASTGARYTEDPHLSGYVSDENLDAIRGSASLLVDEVGDGRIILFVDNPNFRGMWYGTNKLFFNALFFGSTVYAP